MSTNLKPDHVHDWHSPSYVADWINQDVTRDDERRPMLRRVAALIPPVEGRPLRVLDVGGGYGALSAEVLEHWPDAQVTLQDYSDAMITVAKQRLSRYGARVTYTMADMTEPGWVSTLEGPFDAAVSALAIHNLGEPELIRSVYCDLFSVLRPGGTLFNLDLVFPPGPGLVELYRRDPIRNLNWDVHAGLAGLESHLGWLHDAGFSEVDCVWKDAELSLLWGLRPT